MSAPLVKAKPRPQPYDQDYYAWTVAQGRLLREQRPAHVDWENVAEEIESLGRSEKARISSNLNVLVMHLLKWRYQADQRKAGWKGSIVEHRMRVNDWLSDSPSLRRYPGEILSREYLSARLKAIGETGLTESGIPEECPFAIEQILDPDFWPRG